MRRRGRPGEWLIGSARDSLRRASLGAQAVVEVVLDTLGTPELSTLRVVRSEGQLFVELARRELARMRWDLYEPVPGCAARRVVVIPFRFRSGSSLPHRAGDGVAWRRTSPVTLHERDDDVPHRRHVCSAPARRVA